MRTVPTPDADLTTKARIRDAAMEQFATHGVAASTMRAVASAAGVSPGLIVHHFGSKQGLVRAVDQAVLARIDATLKQVPIEEPGTELIARRAEVVAAFLRSELALCDYLGRALVEGSQASAELFHRLFMYAAKDQRLVDAGALRAGTDPFWRAMHQVILIVGPLILRAPIERELGDELLSRENVTRWMRARTDLLQRGLYSQQPVDDVSDGRTG
jgi:TetR/AcrR family transcriptional regulator, regulator of cefoperazone and chloramphenicol sensitivity